MTEKGLKKDKIRIPRSRGQQHQEADIRERIGNEPACQIHTYIHTNK